MRGTADGMTANIDEARTTSAAHRQWDWLRRHVRPMGRRSLRVVQRLTAITWIRRSLWVIGIAAGVLLMAFAALMWRLSRGPIGIDVATPWLTTAIAENFGGTHS